MSAPAPIDPVTLGIVNNGFVNVCREMGITMIRTAFSPIFSYRSPARNEPYAQPIAVGMLA